MGRNKKPQVRRRNNWGQPPPGEGVWEEEPPAPAEEPDVAASLSNGWDAPPQSEFGTELGKKRGKKKEPWRRDECSYCTLCCNVPSGFEREAGEEMREVFERRSTFERRTGFVTVPIHRLEDAQKAHALRSSDKIYVKACTLEGFLTRGEEDTVRCLEKIQEAAVWVDWARALEVWAKFSGRYSGSPFDHPEEYDSRPPTFRVECYIPPESGRQNFGCVDAEEYFAVGVGVHFGWRANKTQSSDIVVGLVVCDRDVTVVIQLKKSVGCESLPGPFGGLRLAPTLAHVLLRLAKIRPGEIVMDPMSGSCSIGVEGAFAWPTAWHLSGDVYVQPIRQTQKKANRLDAVFQMDNVEWNAKRLPLREASVDAIVTDLPCGQQLPKGDKKMYTFSLYKSALKEFARVIRPGSGRAVLMTQDVRPLEDAIRNCKMWRERKSWQVECRGLRSMVYVLDIDANWKYERPQAAAAPVRFGVKGWGQEKRSAGGTPSMERRSFRDEKAVAAKAMGKGKSSAVHRIDEKVGEIVNDGWDVGFSNVGGKGSVKTPDKRVTKSIDTGVSGGKGGALVQGVASERGGGKQKVVDCGDEGKNLPLMNEQARSQGLSKWLISETASLFEKECKQKAAPPEKKASPTDPKSRKECREITKRLKLCINQVGGYWQQVRSNTENLSFFLDSLGETKKRFAYHELARLLMNKCEVTMQNLIFPLTEVVMRTIARNRPLLEIVLEKLHEVCVLTVPKCYEDETDTSEMQKQMGYRIVEMGGTERLETEDEFLQRQKGYVMFYAGLMQVDSASGIHGIDEAWRYLTRLLNSLPPNRTVAFALDSFLQIAGFRLHEKYQSQFVKVLKFIEGTFLVNLAASNDVETNSVYFRLRNYLRQEKFKTEPEGKLMPESAKSSVASA
ncbi:hypothetical protein BSKO_04484 [Bryopsis sp. KO-2023]|nr:hypothetical protein BSKO_04484 [Bryopsis sp. KO-2023]